MVTVADYVHGYSGREAYRLGDQANTLAGLLHGDTGYAAGSRVLEVGCGVGAQTVHLVRASPGARVVAVDVSAESVAQARARVVDPTATVEATVAWSCADLLHLPFPTPPSTTCSCASSWSTSPTPDERWPGCAECCGPAAASR